MRSSSLQERLLEEIRLHGPMSVATYMAKCLGDPEAGYYTTQAHLGAAGDFITAPELTPLFGEMIAAWLLLQWEALGQPSPLQLVELGPGNGTLMADIWRTTQVLPDIRKGASLHLIETSPHLRTQQAQQLAGLPVHWHGDLTSVPTTGPLFLVANEFFDALPIHQFVRSPNGWRERLIDLEGETFRWTLAETEPATTCLPLPDARSLPLGTIVEVSPAARRWTEEIGRRLATQGGVALIIDYGAEAGYGDTLQAVGGHQFRPVLERPGHVDLTAHVNFSALQHTFRQFPSLEVTSLMTQGDFLRRLSIETRAQYYMKKVVGTVDQDIQQARIQQALERLIHPDQMGALFKVLAVRKKV